jgi:hypothetical protein
MMTRAHILAGRAAKPCPAPVISLFMAFALAFVAPASAVAQFRGAPAGPGFSLAPPGGPSDRPVPPGSIPNVPAPSAPAQTPVPPSTALPSPFPSSPPLAAPSPLPQAAPPAAAAPLIPAGQAALNVSARFARDGGPIPSGLVWRVYPARPDPTGVFPVLKEDRGASPTFILPAGEYVVHVTFGLASDAKSVQLRESTRQVFEIASGGLKVKGQVGGVDIPPQQISFDVFKGSQFDSGDKRPLVNNMLTGQVALVPEGTYYIVSNYGDGNAVVRSDIRVQAGKLTDVTVTHRAAVLTLKLVDKKGGEALANTQWSVLTPGGDVIKESIGAFPRVILSEGEYRAIARNEGKTFEQDFKVVTGVDREVEVLAR